MTIFENAVIVFVLLQYWATLVPGTISCFLRISCSSKNVVYLVVADKCIPIQNWFNTTLRTFEFLVILVVMIILNAMLNIAFDYYVVNGTRKKLLAKNRRMFGLFLPRVVKENWNWQKPFKEEILNI